MRAHIAFASLMLAAAPFFVAAGEEGTTNASKPPICIAGQHATGVQARCTPASSWNRIAQHMRSISFW